MKGVSLRMSWSYSINFFWMKEKKHRCRLQFMRIHSSLISYRGQMAKPRTWGTTSQIWHSSQILFWNPPVVHEIHTSVSFSYTTVSFSGVNLLLTYRKLAPEILKRTTCRPETNPHQTTPTPTTKVRADITASSRALWRTDQKAQEGTSLLTTCNFKQLNLRRVQVFTK